MFYTYILYSPKKDRYYVGSCEDIAIRLSQHNSHRNKSTSFGIPWELKYMEIFDTRSIAIQREFEIKRKKSRRYIEWLIHKHG